MSLIYTMFMMGYGHVPLYYIVLVIDIPDVLKRIHAALRRGGVCYISFNDPRQNNGQHVPLKIT
ncbi:hypothetical protein KAM398_21330 [Acinetobacter sp. KAM398]|nr:hypothetical protein KAM394_21240 [Acinetobacter sp. KAM394]GJC43473.1 hypothetical protein KAM396_21700 [Acinetobacter sp. KAM396]GJC46283.1 hypothetical protein KAM397_21630 [Acinetobacter sp. KAM397]GJC49081.1 hypothetical protein KAM398_21330 [Acinetobacter sp. KAM398]GJC63248.1 hypothetical protein KAM403_21980 [Acinetobacter sp. KAM403]GJC71663.1 hypothetical protein KAM406_21430 [Acinetobacter sp. KAM406]